MTERSSASLNCETRGSVPLLNPPVMQALMKSAPWRSCWRTFLSKSSAPLAVPAPSRSLNSAAGTLPEQWHLDRRADSLDAPAFDDDDRVGHHFFPESTSSSCF